MSIQRIMRLTKYFLIFLSCLAFSSCVVQHKAAKYNDKIINEQHFITEHLHHFLKGFKHESLENLKAHRLQLIAITNNSIKKVQAMPPYEGDAQLRDGAVELLKFYLSTLENEYLEMIHLVANKNRTPEEHEKLKQFALALIAEEEKMDLKFEKNQEAFVARHKLEMVEHPIQEAKKP